jgi:hypothetical protein
LPSTVNIRDRFPAGSVHPLLCSACALQGAVAHFQKSVLFQHLVVLDLGHAVPPDEGVVIADCRRAAFLEAGEERMSAGPINQGTGPGLVALHFHRRLLRV